jgi:type I restriction-modification system DNA methylase subunit
MVRKAAFEGLDHLVEKFRANEDEYLSPSFNEAQLRLSFLNPFFRALGWDTENEHEVRVEDASGTAGRPDYVFHLGGDTKFYVEAKKPSANLDDPEIIFQAKRYAWNSQTPNLVVVLTNFRVWRVYDGSLKPDAKKPHVGLLLGLALEDYIDRIEELEKFSREEVAEGSLEALVKASIKKHKDFRKGVDRDFLDQIQAWRKELAKSIYKRNPDLDERTLNETVGRLLDRLVFLRIAEDKKIILGQDNLRNALDQWRARPREELSTFLNTIFDGVNDTLNGEVFKPGHACERYFAESKILERVIEALYPPKCIYRFEVIPVEVLGQMYEQYLGYVLRTTPKQVRLEEKPEVRKAGGVYYTPRYIVDYIVEKTVGEKLEGLTPKQAMRLKILDPACGSGSFLLGAFDHLLRWYEGKRMKGRPLTLTDKGKILTSNLHGVDIDPQAVEITMMSLYLKMLEDEHKPLFSRHVLPLLGDNVKCGNSLIGPDYWEGRLAVDDEERFEINAFDWEAEFPKVFRGKNKGFDCVIGNPPYIRMEAFKEIKHYLRKRFASHEERSDFYTYFMEKAHHLIRGDGRFGMIVSNKFIRSNYGKKIRKVLQKLSTIERVIDLAGLPVFKGATVRTVVLITTKGKAKTHHALYVPPLPLEEFQMVDNGQKSLELATTNFLKVPQASLNEAGWTFARQSESALLGRLSKQCATLSEYVDGKIYRGVVSGLTKAFVIGDSERRAILKSNPKAEEIIKPFLQGRNIRRYYTKNSGQYLIYTYHGIDIKKYPTIEKHLLPYKSRLQKRATRQAWYELQQPQFNYVPAFEAPKIIFPDMATECRFTFDDAGFFGANTMYFLPKNDLYLLGSLNSSLALYYFKHVCAALEGTGKPYLRFFGQYLEQLPIRTINFSNPKEKKMHDEIVVLVERMLALHKKLRAAPEGTSRRAQLERDIKYTDAAIDKLVYKLYGLTEEEVKVVEGR